MHPSPHYSPENCLSYASGTDPEAILHQVGLSSAGYGPESSDANDDVEDNCDQDDCKGRVGHARTPQSHRQLLCEGDLDIVTEFLPQSLEAGIFERLRDEVEWRTMSHQGGPVPRLVAVQGLVTPSGTEPVYRHPSDESPPLSAFSPTVLAIRSEAERLIGHPLNHVLIQLYRDGGDYISEHSDKTLDLVPGSMIANVSLGAQRTMVLRTKRLDRDPCQSYDLGEDDGRRRSRRIERLPLPHNSLCRMGPHTNMRWMHAIRQDRRADWDKQDAELSHGGQRISLTFRHIGTFLDRSKAVIWGRGATSKSRDEARPIVAGHDPEATRMLLAFGTENRSSNFDWHACYGCGFDVLDIRPPLLGRVDANHASVNPH